MKRRRFTGIVFDTDDIHALHENLRKKASSSLANPQRQSWAAQSPTSSTETTTEFEVAQDPEHDKGK